MGELHAKNIVEYLEEVHPDPALLPKDALDLSLIHI